MSWVVKGVWNSPQYLKQTFFMFIVQKTTNVIPFFEVCQTCQTQAMEAGRSDSHAHTVQVVLTLTRWRISTNRCCFSLLHSSWTPLPWRLINPDIIQMEDITYISKLTLLTWRNARVSKRPNVLHYAGHIAMPNSIEKISQFNDSLLISKPIYTRAYEPSCLFVYWKHSNAFTKKHTSDSVRHRR